MAGIALLILGSAFALRVLAQLVQLLSPVSHLPPFSQWQSGVLPYPFLLACQALILALLFRTALGHVRNRVTLVRETGRKLLILGGLYAGTMVVRYTLHMLRVPADRWLGGCIPIFFHLVLAGFLITAGLRHFRLGAHVPAGLSASPFASRASVLLWRSAVALIILGLILWTVNRVCML